MAESVPLDSSMNFLEETRIKKKYSELTAKLCGRVHFSYSEIEHLIILYYKVQKDNSFKSKGLMKHQFREFLYKTLGMKNDVLMDRIFLVINTKDSYTICTVEHWVEALSLLLRGTLEEQINYCFKVYDLHDEGKIGRENIYNLIRNAIIGTTDDESEECVKDLIEIITKKMDTDRDGKISFNDYKNSVLKQPLLLEVFGQCLPSRKARLTFLTTFTNKKKL